MRQACMMLFNQLILFTEQAAGIQERKNIAGHLPKEDDIFLNRFFLFDHGVIPDRQLKT
jgi:hypothetical protein